MRTFLGVLSATAMAVSLAAVAPAQALSGPQPGNSGVTASAAATAAADRFGMRDRFAREITRYGDADRSVYNIDHVYELQYRLRWRGVYDGPVTGTFGTQTRQAVKRFQRREDIRVTGVAGHQTWAHLLRDTVRHRGKVPRICKSAGWHACYDRKMHQVTLWHGGRLKNTWLVRGGSYTHKTRTGNTYVYYRNKDHHSQLYDSPMPYSQFFDGGQALHGSATMVNPFSGHSHGCVNMYIEDARQLWNITHDKRLRVSVYGAWD
ncbi:MAG: murein L,D-transpeptidase [Nocardioidaceae bacterium]|nr:murein L,D-transpeptidase [Nocardioidaceae bacterium]